MSWQPRLTNLIRTTGLVLLSAVLALPAWALDQDQWKALNVAAEQASHDCLHLMHHDTDEFSACVDTQFDRSAGKPATQLGVAYLGLVGCLSSVRIATLHADICTRSNLRRVDGLRKRLHVSDKELCPAVRGDCASRMAQIEAVRDDVRKSAKVRS